jgi:hypothetical protein
MEEHIMANYSVSSRLQFLARYISIPPEAWDFIIPQGPKMSTALKELVFAQIVRDIANGLPSPMQKSALNLKDVGREMTTTAAGGLVAGWEEGDDICPKWPWWKGGPIPPRPLDELAEIQERLEDSLDVYASALRYIARYTQVKGAEKKLTQIANEIDQNGKVTLRQVA